MTVNTAAQVTMPGARALPPRRLRGPRDWPEGRSVSRIAVENGGPWEYVHMQLSTLLGIEAQFIHSIMRTYAQMCD
mgnify:CR=1 FL=1